MNIIVYDIEYNVLDEFYVLDTETEDQIDDRVNERNGNTWAYYDIWPDFD